MIWLLNPAYILTRGETKSGYRCMFNPWLVPFEYISTLVNERVETFREVSINRWKT